MMAFTHDHGLPAVIDNANNDNFLSIGRGLYGQPLYWIGSLFFAGNDYAITGWIDKSVKIRIIKNK